MNAPSSNGVFEEVKKDLGQVGQRGPSQKSSINQKKWISTLIAGFSRGKKDVMGFSLHFLRNPLFRIEMTAQ